MEAKFYVNIMGKIERDGCIRKHKEEKEKRITITTIGGIKHKAFCFLVLLKKRASGTSEIYGKTYLL
jgi:hypothetical protein